MSQDLNNIADVVRVFFHIIKQVCNSLEKVLLFLIEEVRILEETKGINLPNFLLRSAFLVLLKKKVETIDQVPQDLVNGVWEYVEELVMKVLLKHSDNFPQMQSPCRRAVQTLMDKARLR
ncbi:unnamed protein product [Miscanthus lutarioriparius]|uniref:Dynamin stalk domain-containing protein n=1 Tax=Miscanthus lutarioriparius TaxID=422564 RepID=A0A811M8T2_9POAL|nr:unnamed protein product [Miscanthus lutarioriparius]